MTVIFRSLLGLVLICTATMSSAAHSLAPNRPAITGISHIAFYSRDLAAADHFYGYILGGTKSADQEDPQGVRYYFGRQFIEVLPARSGGPGGMLEHVAYTTTGARQLRAYLLAHGSKPGELHDADGTHWFAVRDPEGNEVEFVDGDRSPALRFDRAVSRRIIHVGYLVRSRATEDSFYRGLLGFRPYWVGAMHGKAVDWVSQQVPDGRDWLEYMMVGPGSTVPTDSVDERLLGVLDHVSLAVANMEEAVTRLYAEDRLPQRHDGPAMGRDGKWQANLYDPDGTRVELMEYHAVAKPCCSSFTATDPVR